MKPVFRTSRTALWRSPASKPVPANIRTRFYASPTKPLKATLSKEPFSLATPPPSPPLHPEAGPSPAAAAAQRPPPPSPRTDRTISVTIKHLRNLSLSVHCPELGLKEASFPYVWLRDADPGPASVDPATKQKLFRTSDVPLDIFPLETAVVKVTAPASPEGEEPALRVVWSKLLQRDPRTGQSTYEPDASVYPLSYLASFASPAAWSARHRSSVLAPRLWTLPTLQALPRSELYIPYYEFLASEQTRYLALKQLVQRGLVFFTGVPTEPRDGWHTELRTLVEKGGLGELRRTFYGDLWDVKSQGKEAKNVAYTNLNLDLHMDLVHFQNPPRFQLLHMLHNRVSGGLSTFVDSYSACREILSASPGVFATLCERPVAFEYVNGGHHTQFVHPTVSLRPGWTAEQVAAEPGSLAWAVEAVNYSPPFQGALLTHPPVHLHPRGRRPPGPADLPDAGSPRPYTAAQQLELLRALGEFAAVCERPDHRYEVRLEEGVVAAFDNRRVLHARTAFEEVPDERGGAQQQGGEARPEVKRWLKGAYVEGDSVWDRLRVLDAKYGEAETSAPE